MADDKGSENILCVFLFRLFFLSSWLVGLLCILTMNKDASGGYYRWKVEPNYLLNFVHVWLWKLFSDMSFWVLPAGPPCLLLVGGLYVLGVFAVFTRDHVCVSVSCSEIDSLISFNLYITLLLSTHFSLLFFDRTFYIYILRENTRLLYQQNRRRESQRYQPSYRGGVRKR
jgi:hypothetical protein